MILNCKHKCMHKPNYMIYNFLIMYTGRGLFSFKARNITQKYTLIKEDC